MGAGGRGAFLQISGLGAPEAQPRHFWACRQGLPRSPAAAPARVPPTLLPREALHIPCPPLSPLRASPPARALREPAGQPEGVARRRPAPLMCAGAAVIGQSLVTCGDCGGPGCCGSRSASRGSGSGSRAFKGDAAAARGDGGQVEGAAQTHIIHGPSGLEGLVSRSPEIRGWIRHRVPSNSPIYLEKLRDPVPLFSKGLFFVTTKGFGHLGQSCQRSWTSQRLWPWPANQPLPGRLAPRPLSLAPSSSSCSSPPRSQDGGMAAQGAPRFLLTFDFDETIVDENSDDSIVRAAPGQRLPESLRATYREGFYNEYMQRVFQYLGEQGVRPRDLRAIYEAIPLSPGMSDLLQFVAKQGSCFEVILISDANTFGVESALRAAGHHGLFRRILSNPSGPDARGLLALRPFHTHSCARCPANMCKHKVLSDYLRERAHDGVHFERLFYVGDGANDFCPMGLLAGGDVAFPRRGYPMHRLIQEAQKAEPSSFRASVVPWETATDVRLHLQQVLKTC